MPRKTVILICLILLASLASLSRAEVNTLRLLGVFETLQTLGFSPDGVTLGRAAHLFISSAPAPVPNELGVFEVTLQGDLVRHVQLPVPPSGNTLGYSIARATSGPAVGNFFLATFSASPNVQVFEFDSELNLVDTFDFQGPAWPGDGLAFNHHTKNLAVIDFVTGDVVEVTTSGDIVRSISTPMSYPAGITYNRPTKTYFAVEVSARTLVELSPTTGEVIRVFDLSPYGVKQPVGIASGQGKLFIADELDELNSGGMIWAFKSPRRARRAR